MKGQETKVELKETEEETVFGLWRTAVVCVGGVGNCDERKPWTINVANLNQSQRK